ncbi:hypothetical protein WJX81_005543 [Elliptochloris bilobata]|uniref:Uncharacterized protein n=1 Tax=Elliptochloris bilobata TaxID=381761 RepID=A0AAW1RE27_9CHLO
MWERVANLPNELRQRCLENAGVTTDDQNINIQPDETDWGFATRLPSAHCVEAMAETLRVFALVEGLQGSVVTPSEQRCISAAARLHLKAAIKAAWSREAVSRGVAAAKKADYALAHRCYERALDLDPRNADAWVARGAAFANQQHFSRAADDFSMALEVDPCDANAAKYLAATRTRMQELGIVPQPARGAQDGRAAAAGTPDASGSSEADSGGSGSAADGMDLARALQIVADHYRSRNAPAGEAGRRSKHKRKKRRKDDAVSPVGRDRKRRKDSKSSEKRREKKVKRGSPRRHSL